MSSILLSIKQPKVIIIMKKLFSSKDQLKEIKEDVYNDDRLFFEKIVNYKVLNEIFEMYKKDNNIKKSKLDILLDNFELNTIIMTILMTSVIGYFAYKNEVSLFIPFFFFVSSIFNVYFNTRLQIKNGIKNFIKECYKNRPQSMDNLLIYTKELIANSEKDAMLKSCSSNNNEKTINKKRL